MRSVLRYLLALIAVVCLMGSALLAVLLELTEGDFIREVNGAQAVNALAQTRIDEFAAALTETFHLSPETLAPWREDADWRLTESLAVWWDALWHAPQAETALPYWLDDEQVAILVADIRRDEGFQSVTDEAMRKAIARDEVAYALDEAVCDATLPLRRAVVETSLTLLTRRVTLPLLRENAATAALALAICGGVCLLIAWRAAGSACLAMALTMLLCCIPVALYDLPGRLAELNPIAEAQGRELLRFLAERWLGWAAVAAAAGLAILLLKRLYRRRRARCSKPSNTAM